MCVAALPDGVHFVIGDVNGEVRLYHVDGTLVHTFKVEAPLEAVAVTPNGEHIISAGGHRVNKVWSVATKSLVSTCEGHTGSVSAVAAMPDGKRFLSGGGVTVGSMEQQDFTVRVWLLDGTLENTFELHAHMVTALVALPDNQHALSASHDTTVKLFNVNDGAVVRTFTARPVECLALLPDGRRFVTGSEGAARIYEHGLAPQ
jgi:WD40 repeat protein